MTELRPGDLVEVRSVSEIAQTLDADGMLDHLPFMIEMVAFCGQRFRVAQRALTICLSGGTGGPYRGFDTNDVVTLDEVRCNGAAHDGCQKACRIFWREAWLRKVDDRTPVAPPTDPAARETLWKRLRSFAPSGRYCCQASELPKATRKLSGPAERMTQYLSGWRHGNYNAMRMVRSVSVYTMWYARRKLFGLYARGTNTQSPVESLNMQPGEWVMVKPLHEIVATLDHRATNRGLYFSPDMRLWCGRKLRVRSRLDRIIVDGTGEMRQMRNTVCLEGPTCGCAYQGLGSADCSRCELTYWREIWLQRCDGSSS